MLTFKEFKLLNESFVSQRELDEIERYLDRIFDVLGIDIEFTKHFLDRINDSRNKKQITGNELIDAFVKLKQKYGMDINSRGDNFQAVINDINSNINIPFVLNYDRRNNEIDLVSKTIMRKKDFRTSNRKYRV